MCKVHAKWPIFEVMNDNRDITVSFTGHRTYRHECDDAVTAAVERLYGEGYRTFMTGMAVGFDLAAGECVLSLRYRLCGLRLVCVVPFRGMETRFAQADRGRFGRLMREADATVIIADEYIPEVYHRRNDFLVDNASFVLAYFDGRAGGTAYTVARAKREGLRVENLYRDGQLELFEP